MSNKATGTLIGIARSTKVRGAMEELSGVLVTEDAGLDGDRRGAVKGAQVTILARQDWEAACQDIGADLPWMTRRANLYVDGFDLPRTKGARLQIGAVILEVTEETTPCSLMEEAATGLREALTPQWRGGVRCNVVRGGQLSPDDLVKNCD